MIPTSTSSSLYLPITGNTQTSLSELHELLSKETFSWGISFEDSSSNFRTPKKRTEKSRIIKNIGFFFGELNKTCVIEISPSFVSNFLLNFQTDNYTYNAQEQLKILLEYGELGVILGYLNVGELGKDVLYGSTLMDCTMDTIIAVYLLDPDRGDKLVFL
jgi:hypothetical protein